MNHLFQVLLFMMLAVFIPGSEIIAQGELLNRGESGGALLLSTAKVRNYRSNALGYSYTIKRNFELGFAGLSGPRQNNRGFTEKQRGLACYGAAFIQTKSIFQAKLTAGIQFFDGDSDTFLAATFFVNNSKGDNKVVPSVSIQRAGGDTFFSGSLDFKLKAMPNIIGGVNVLTYRGKEAIFTFSLGLMLVRKDSK